MANLKDEYRRIKLATIVRHNNFNHVFIKKGVFYGDFLDEYIYKKVMFTHKNKKRIDYNKSMKTGKREDNLWRTRNNIYRITHANVRKHGNYSPIFCTLTYKKDQESLKEVRREYKYFIFKLNNLLGHKVQYLCVPEIQQKRLDKYGKAVWHLHIVFFNLPFIDINTFKNLWSHGSVDLQKVRKIKNIGAYIAKYLTKDTYDSRLYGQRAYNCSRGIIRPYETYDDLQIDKYLEDDSIKLLSEYKTELKTIKIWKK